MKKYEHRPLETYLPTVLRSRIVDHLNLAADETARRSPELSRPTIGLMFSNLACRRLSDLSAAVGESVLAVDETPLPVIYRLGDLRLLHYSVHGRRNAYTTNPGKNMVRDYLLWKNQYALFDAEEEFSGRLDGPLAVLATELQVIDVEKKAKPTRIVVLNHAFVGYPKSVSESNEIIEWEEGRVQLLPHLGEGVEPEEQRRVKDLPLRAEAPKANRRRSLRPNGTDSE